MQTVRLTLGSAEGTLSLQGMEKLVIHPDYYQHLGGTVGHTDVALIKTNQAIFETNDNNTATENPTIAPICLPPKLGYDPTMEAKMQEEEQVLQPFEDLDCLLLPGDRAVPYPYTSGQHSRGWLSCHPASLTSASNIAEAGGSVPMGWVEMVWFGFGVWLRGVLEMTGGPGGPHLLHHGVRLDDAGGSGEVSVQDQQLRSTCQHVRLLLH